MSTSLLLKAVLASNVCAGDAGSHPERGAVGGAEMTYREDMSPSTQPDGRASSLSPRYEIKHGKALLPGGLVCFCPGFRSY